VGASVGQFASAARALFPASQLYCFEPLHECVETLRHRFRRDYSFMAFETALGDSAGETMLWVSRFRESSSLLRMAAAHTRAFPWTTIEGSRTVNVAPIDAFLDRMRLEPPTLLKIDVQGYEGAVLRGAPRLLERVDSVLCEVSFAPLYEEQSDFASIHGLLSARGFRYCGAVGDLRSPLDDRILQEDALFVRPSSEGGA
jgi:FkbM family methyltransferase